MGARGWVCTQSCAGGYLLVPLGADHPPASQKYMQKQVMPLFNHYKNITNGWMKIPSDLMDQ